LTNPINWGIFFSKIFLEILKRFSYKVFFTLIHCRGDYPPYLTYIWGREGRGDTPTVVREGVWGVFTGEGSKKTPM
jgi:hypothetical protein